MDNNKNFQILIVDDHEANIRVLGATLSQAGYRIIVATDGLQALKVLEKIIPDLILLDINMPNLDGLETCKQIKNTEATKHIPVIFLSARIETEDIIKGFEIGAADYITKPFKQAELLARVKTQLALQWQSKQLQENHRQIQELVRVLLHDLANPLSGIKGILEIVSEKTEKFSQFYPMIQNSLNNCFSILENIRKMKSLEDGKMQINLKATRIKTIISPAFFIFQKELDKKNLKLNIDIPDDLTAMIEVGTFTNSIFNNILTNAIKFSHPNSTIEIKGEKIDEWTKIAIKDSGIGMPDYILQDIFSLNKPTTRKGTNGEFGTGYGMPIVKKFTEAFGGKIEIESKEGEDHGTTIKLYFLSKEK